MSGPSSRQPVGSPASKVADTDLGEVVVLDVDATLVTAHSEKEAAAATFKGGCGYHPLGVWCDNTSEMLAAVPRPGNAGSNTAADRVEVLTAAINQVPPEHRRKILVRADGAGASHGLLDWLTEQNTKRGCTVEYSVGFAVTAAVRDAITRVPKSAWQAAVDADGEVREGGHVVELTGMLDLKKWPDGMRIIVRRERPHPGATVSVRGGRRVALPSRRHQHAGRRQRAARVPRSPPPGARPRREPNPAREGFRLGRFPSREFTINQVWTMRTAIAADLVAWLRLLALPEALKACEPKALRYRLLHVPARVTRGARRRRLRIPQSWPWAEQIATTFERITTIPAPT